MILSLNSLSILLVKKETFNLKILQQTIDILFDSNIFNFISILAYSIPDFEWSSG